MNISNAEKSNAYIDEIDQVVGTLAAYLDKADTKGAQAAVKRLCELQSALIAWGEPQVFFVNAEAE